MLYSYEYPQYRLFNSNLQQQQQQFAPTNGQRLARIMAMENGNADNLNNGNSDTDNEQNSMFGSPERAQPSSNIQEDNQQEQNSNINLNTRSSMQSSTRSNMMNLPKGFISNILYGRSNSASIPSFATFNKKAEPKDNFFMHFGRK